LLSLLRDQKPNKESEYQAVVSWRSCRMEGKQADLVLRLGIHTEIDLSFVSTICICWNL